jgi:hypothetical protein
MRRAALFVSNCVLEVFMVGLPLRFLFPMMMFLAACGLEQADEPASPTTADIEQHGEISPQFAPYVCGYAQAGQGCNNGRGSTQVIAADMNDAVSTCLALKPASLPDFCYVISVQWSSVFDELFCGAAGGSWRPGTACCNFLGTVSCPTSPPPYRCGYARAGHNCNNWRASIVLNANSMASAVTACRANQPPDLSDFCYVRQATTGTANDVRECAWAGGTWRPASACCNFLGSLSCP